MRGQILQVTDCLVELFARDVGWVATPLGSWSAQYRTELPVRAVRADPKRSVWQVERSHVLIE